MVGLVIVSHSAQLAAGVRELAVGMTGDQVQISTAGGIDDPDHPIGTDPIRVMAAITEVYTDDGVVVLMDLGSALMSAETALELLDPDWLPNIHLCDAPLVEGTVAAAVQASIGGDAASIMAEARASLLSKQQHLGLGETDFSAAAVTHDANAQSRKLIVPNAQGIHARPAARIVQLAAAYPATLTIARGGKHVSGNSINQVALLGARQGDELTFFAEGVGASDLLAALHDLCMDNFGDSDAEADPERLAEASVAEVPEGVLAGVAASGGLALGTVYRFDTQLPGVDYTRVEDANSEIERFDRALNEAVETLQTLKSDVSSRVGAVAAAIFDAHSLMLQDADILTATRHYIEDEQVNAAFAWWRTIESLADDYRNADSDLLRGRAQDVLDVGARVLRLLSPIAIKQGAMPTDVIVVADDLTPSETAQLDPEKVRGIVTASGGATSHTAVIARSLGIPAVVGVGVDLHMLDNGRYLAVDGDRGWLHTDLTDAQISTFQAEIAERQSQRQVLIAASQQRAVTTDQRQIEVAANIGTAADAEHLVEMGAEGVGLFRTELLFMGRATAPTEQEQFEAYTAAATHLPTRPIIVRTLDVGGDKRIDYIDIDREENPFLGYRGIRYWLGNRDLARTQLRAVCRASAGHSIKVMFPMVGTLDELKAGLQVLREVQAQLTDESLAYDPDMEVGIMIEVPSAVFIADQLAKHVDFVSIGTNDLTQYIMAADRGNARVSPLATPFQPAVLRAIKTVVDAFHARGKWVGMCGEFAGNPTATALLVGLGLDELSMSAPAIPAVKAVIRELSYEAAQQLAETALTLPTAADILQFLNDNKA